MRNAECGTRNVRGGVARRATFHVNSAFRIPHSALGAGGSRADSRLPRALLGPRRDSLPMAQERAGARSGFPSVRLRGRDGRDRDHSARIRGGQLPTRGSTARAGVGRAARAGRAAHRRRRGLRRSHGRERARSRAGRRVLLSQGLGHSPQLREVTDLVRRCADTRFVLIHCGKPAIRHRRLELWRSDIACLAAQENVCCKLSGLLTEAEPQRRRDEDLIPYAASVVECFGTERVLYGSDWPVLILAGSCGDWYGFTERFTAGWTAAERRRFYADNAIRVYAL